MGTTISLTSSLLKHECSGRNITWAYINANTPGYLPPPYDACVIAAFVLRQSCCHDGTCHDNWPLASEHKRYSWYNWDGKGDPYDRRPEGRWYQCRYKKAVKEWPMDSKAIREWSKGWEVVWPKVHMQAGGGVGVPRRINDTENGPVREDQRLGKLLALDKEAVKRSVDGGELRLELLDALAAYQNAFGVVDHETAAIPVLPTARLIYPNTTISISTSTSTSTSLPCSPSTSLLPTHLQHALLPSSPPHPHQHLPSQNRPGPSHPHHHAYSFHADTNQLSIPHPNLTVHPLSLRGSPSTSPITIPIVACAIGVLFAAVLGIWYSRCRQRKSWMRGFRGAERGGRGGRRVWDEDAEVVELELTVFVDGGVEDEEEGLGV